MFRIAVLDGFDETREGTLRALREAGHEADGFDEEDSLLTALPQRRADIVLLDVPTDEAIDAAVAVRALAIPQPRLVALLERAQSTDRERARARTAGIDFVILRPCPPGEVVKHLQRFR